MNALLNFMDKYFLPVAGKIAEQRHLQAIRDGIILVMPFIIIGSIFLILANFPIPGYTEFLTKVFGDGWQQKLTYPVSATFDIMALIAVFGIAYRLAERYKIDALTSGALALSAFLLATPFSIMHTPEGATDGIPVDGVIPVALMGSQGLFVAIVLAILSTEIYRWFIKRDITINLPEGVPPAVSKSFVALIPGTVIILFVWIIRLVLEQTSFENAHNVIGDILYAPLSHIGGGLIGVLVGVTIMTLLWFAGIHGDSVVNSVMSPIWLSQMDENRMAFEAGEELPNIVTSQFIANFVHIGGTGATIAAVIVIIFWIRSREIKDIGKVSLGPAIFNINEPVIFGLPIVMNPLLIIPFVLTPIVIILTTYFSMSLGLVAKPIGVAVPWTTPPIISGYLATGSISGAVIQIINIGIGILIWLPFLLVLDRQALSKEK